ICPPFCGICNSAASKTASLQLALSLCDKMLRVKVVRFALLFFQRWEFLRPFGSKRTKFERQIPNFAQAEFGNSAEHRGVRTSNSA
ncbi:MAG: hypothetical protein J6034_01435, partial [Bacteroidaceae bacterium]|nr:hypothetical protein [Bacteroidaceae bacterium]